MKDIQREYESNKAYRQAHPELYRAATKKWYRANREAALAKAKAYRTANREKYRLYNKHYRQAHLEELRQQDRERHEVNREAELVRNRQYRQANREDIEGRRLKRDYGLSLAQYKELSDKQGGRCAICGKTPKRLCVDHCHESTRVRGLLCRHCNSLLGMAKDDVTILGQAAAYLSTASAA